MLLFSQVPVYTRHCHFTIDSRIDIKDLDVHKKIVVLIDADNAQGNYSDTSIITVSFCGLPAKF